jgi:hypothetical protein
MQPLYQSLCTSIVVVDTVFPVFLIHCHYTQDVDFCPLLHGLMTEDAETSLHSTLQQLTLRSLK